jgi:hypothetical protein
VSRCPKVSKRKQTWSTPKKKSYIVAPHHFLFKGKYQFYDH